MAAITVEEARSAVATVVDPTFEKTLGELGTIANLAVHGDRVSLTVRLSTPSEAVRARVKEAIDRALAPLGVSMTEVDWQVHVPTREATSSDPIPDVRNVILVMSGKGGVGKSTVAANLALALRRAGTRVGLLDADIYGPSVPTMLGITGHPISKDGKRVSPLERFGLKLMSIGFLLDDPKQAVVWRGPMLHGALQQFVADVDWGPLDYLILDLPPGTGDVALTLAQKVKVTGVVMVTTPQEVALQDVYKGVSMCQKLNLPILGVVENMSFFIDSAGVRHELFGAGGGEKVAEMSKAPLLGKIPMETAVREWGDRGTPIVQAAPGSAAGEAFTAIAEKVAERVALAHFERTGGEKAPPAEGPKRLKILR
ncbi:MAG: Mrp/NBP35 family ATP-binding protein [Polyangiaceae bacterium]|nr:Mrp/NBP35 family ATP-binding protein [Polyangiaceae bacterium]